MRGVSGASEASGVPCARCAQGSGAETIDNVIFCVYTDYGVILYGLQLKRMGYGMA